MSFFGRLFSKQSQGRTVLAMNQVGQAQPTPRNYAGFAKEGYQANVIAFKCVSILARSIAGLNWTVYQDKPGGKPKEIEDANHPLKKLLARPNPMQSRAAFFEAFAAYFLIAGNSYLESVAGDRKGTPQEIWPLRPDMMKVIPGPYGLPQSYEFGSSGTKKIFPVDPITGLGDVMQMKTFHPTDNWYGMSPIEAMVYSVDQHNESGKWNLSLLVNMGTPSGAFVVKQDASNPMGTLAEPQYKNLKNQIKDQIQGSKNAGRVILLEGGLDWKSMGFSPKDMDWLQGRNGSAREICNGYNVPTILVGIPGDSTFNNYREARMSLYEDTVIPFADFIVSSLNHWLAPRFGENVRIGYDADKIEALASKRVEKMASVDKISFLSTNEKRLTSGYDAVEGGDVVLVQGGLVPLDQIGVVEPAPVSDPAPQDPNGGAEGGDQPNAGNENAPNGEEDNPEDVQDALDKHDDDITLEVKQVNVLTDKGKRRAWKQVNSARKKLFQAMYLDVKDELHDQASDVAKSVIGVSPDLWEFAALRAIDKTEAKMNSVIRKHLNRGMKVFAQPILESGKAMGHEDFETKNLVKFNQFVEAFVSQNGAKQVTEIQGTSKKKARSVIKRVLGAGLQDGESERTISKNLQEELDTLSDGRARTIARTEIGFASSNGAMGAAKALDIPDLEKEWVSDQRPFADLRDDPSIADHQIMNGVKVGLDEKFDVPPDASMEGPHDPSAGPEQVINCNCVVVFARAGKAFMPTFEES